MPCFTPSNSSGGTSRRATVSLLRLGCPMHCCLEAAVLTGVDSVFDRLVCLATTNVFRLNNNHCFRLATTVIFVD